MAKESVVKTHTSQSNRKTRVGLERKVAFRSVLENPLSLPWPPVPLNVQNSILAVFLDMMHGVADFHRERQLASMKSRRKGKKSSLEAVGEAPLQDHTDITMEAETEKPGEDSGKGMAASRPAVLEHLVIGINEVTRRLERQCRGKHVSSTESSATPLDGEPTSTYPISTVLVCKTDVDPPFLISHLPHLVAACNAKAIEPSQYVKLIPLPQNAEFSLAQVMGLRRVAVLAMDCTVVQDPRLSALFESVQPVSAPWLVSLAPLDPEHVSQEPSEVVSKRRKTLIPTHVKQLRTTAPKDMRAAKEQRVKARAEAKRRKQENVLPRRVTKANLAK